MTSRGPIVTLATVAVLGLLLFVMNLSQAPGTPPTAAAPAATSGAPAATSATPEATSAAAEPAAAATSFPPQASYTGKTQGKATGEAAVAVTVKGDQASAYVCDGQSVEAWYKGLAKDGTVDLKGKRDNALTGTHNGDTITGTVSAQGKSWRFTATLAEQPAGLYRSSAGGVTTGWIQQPDGSVTGLQEGGGPAGELDTATAQRIEGDLPTSPR